MTRPFLTAAALLLLTACASDDTAGPDLTDARVRFVHALADTSAVDFRINATLNASQTAVPYGAASAYLSVSAGTLAFAVQPSPSESADKPRSLASLNQIRVSDGASLTVLGAGQARDTVSGRAAALSAYVDDVTQPAGGQARLRVINGAADADGLDLYVTPAGGAVTGTPTFAGVDYRSTLTTVMAPGSYTLTLTALSEPATVLATGSITLPAGGAQTVVVVGFSGTLPFGVPVARRIGFVTMVNRAP
ncbi:MAG: DUF4397 domain-containing protein [Gemmatimonadaceae bacterium]|nr:DUF4397 domain-containing protein [Gemmatimonadaceae bacterium]